MLTGLSMEDPIVWLIVASLTASVFASLMLTGRSQSPVKLKSAQAQAADELPEDRSHSVAVIEAPPLSQTDELQVRRGELICRPFRNDLGVNRGIAVTKVQAPPVPRPGLKLWSLPVCSALHCARLLSPLNNHRSSPCDTGTCVGMPSRLREVPTDDR